MGLTSPTVNLSQLWGKGLDSVIDVEKYLEQVDFIDKKIENKLSQKQQWEDLAYKLTANSGESVLVRNASGKLELQNAEKVQASGRGDTMSKAIIECLRVVEEICGVVDELVKVKTEFEKTIEQLQSITEYDVLYKRYLLHIELTDIAELYGKEYTWATTTHGRAKASLQRVLNKGA